MEMPADLLRLPADQMKLPAAKLGMPADLLPLPAATLRMPAETFQMLRDSSPMRCVTPDCKSPQTGLTRQNGGVELAATTPPAFSGRFGMGGTGYQPVRRGNLPRRMERRLDSSASSPIARLTRFARLVARSTQGASCRAASSAASSGATESPRLARAPSRTSAGRGRMLPARAFPPARPTVPNRF